MVSLPINNNVMLDNKWLLKTEKNVAWNGNGIDKNNVSELEAGLMKRIMLK